MNILKYIALPLSFLLSACSYEIELGGSIDRECHITVNILNGEPQIRYIAVVEELDGQPNFDKVVWHVDGDYKKLARFSYGEIPDGFKETVSPETLQKGSNYYFVVNGSGGGYGMEKVEYKCLTKPSI